MSLRFHVNDRSDYIAEYIRLQKKITAKIATHQGQCGEDGDRGEDATGLVTTSSSVATFLCNLMQFIEGPDDVAIDEDTQATPTPTFIAPYTSNVDVDWYIEGGADAQYFQLKNQASQFVELHRDDNHYPDYETKPTYTITLVGVRQSNQVEIRKPITIHINDVDDTPPILTGSANVSVQENTLFVATYSSSEDVDWNLGGTDAAAFEKVDETDSSVTIQFKVAPDYEVDQNEYNIYLAATDKSVNANNASIDIHVTVTDVDDTAPTINGNFQPTVQENTRFVGTYTSEVVTWELTGADAALFMLDGGVANNIDIYFINAPDFETEQNTYNINLIATDTAGNSRTQALTITVTDVDDTAPVITGHTTKSMAENVSDKTIGTYTTDEDIDLWELTGTDAAFAELINSSARSTTVQLKDDTALNYDTKQTYTMTLRAMDNNNNSTSITITVTIEDVDQELPIITGPSTVSVLENTTVVGTYQSNEDVTWAVDDSTFRLTNNAPRSVQVEFATAPDFEGDDPTTYNINLTAIDNAGNSAIKEINITVTDVDDTPPVILSGPTAHTIAENSTTLDIGTYTSSEDIATWTLIGTDVTDFTLTQDDVRHATLALKASPDYETKSVYNVSVTATDLAGNTSTPTALVVTVTDVDEIPPVISGNTSVDKLEGATNKAVGTYTADEPIASWTLDGDDKDFFNIDNMGDQTIGIILKPELEYDYETKTQYNLTLKATDNYGNPGILYIQVNVLNDPSDDSFSGVLPVLPSGYVLLDDRNNNLYRGMKEHFTIEAATASAPAKLIFTYSDGYIYRTYEYYAASNRYEYFDNEDLYYIAVTRNPDMTYHLTYTDDNGTTYDPVLLTWVTHNTDIKIEENTQTSDAMVFSTTFNVNEWKVGGADADKFEFINMGASTAQLQFKVAPNFEAPASTTGSNTYQVQLQGVADGVTYQQDLQIQVTNGTEITGPAQLTLPAGAAANQPVATYTTDNGITSNSQGGYNSMHTWAVLDDTDTFTWKATPQQAWLGSLSGGLVDAPYLFGEVALQLNAPAVPGTYSITMAANTFDGTYNKKIDVGSDDVYFTCHSIENTTVSLGNGYEATEYTLPRAIKNQRYKQRITLAIKPQITVFGQTITLTSVNLRDILNLPNGLTFRVLNETGTEMSKTELTDVPVPSSGVANMQAYVLTPGTTDYAKYNIDIDGTPTESQGNIQLQLILRGVYLDLVQLNVPTPFDKDVVSTDPTYTITQTMLTLGNQILGLDAPNLESTINILLPRFKIEATDTADLTHDVTVTVNYDNVITVSGGNFSTPFYDFTANGNSITELQANTTYVFQRQDNATSHPFSINNKNAITGTSTVTVTTGATNSQIPWVCTTHPSMNGSFTVV